MSTYRQELVKLIAHFEMPGDPLVTATQIGLKKALALYDEMFTGTKSKAVPPGWPWDLE